METQDLKETFDLFDSNSDGLLSQEEFTIILRVLGIAVKINQINEQFKQYVKNDGISYEDFLLSYGELKQKLITKEEMIKAVNMLDKKKTDFIPSSELKRILSSVGDGMSQQEINDLFNLIGIDEQGVVKVGDFVDHLSNIYQ